MVESLYSASEQARNHGIDLSKLPQNLDMTADSITDNVHAINNANCSDERTKFVFQCLVNHLHEFVRETSLTNQEWLIAIKFLTETGKMCSDIRQEFILLADALGVSALVDTIHWAKPPGATECTILGPFFSEEVRETENGGSIASEDKGDYMFVEGRVLDLHGNPIPNAEIYTWETDGHGLYDTQYASRDGPECRGRLFSAADGSYAFRAVMPVPYPIPDDGPVGRMCSTLGRHVYRPAHLHVRINAGGFEEMITSLFFKGDPYVMSDAVFGVKSSLIVDPELITDPSITQARGFRDPKPHSYLKQDFILATVDEAIESRNKSRAERLKGRK